MKRQSYLLVALTIALLVCCQSAEGISTGEPLPTYHQTSNPGTDIMTPPMTSITLEQDAQQLILQARVQLAQKLGINVEEIFLFSVDAVEWPDASLGCPQAGVMYAQVITPGYRILLEANGQVFIFHTDETSQVILCNARGPDEIYLPP